jgi:hypothetical protein
MVLGAFASLRHFPEIDLLYYNDWQDVQALTRVITEVIVIALKLRWSPQELEQR